MTNQSGHWLLRDGAGSKSPSLPMCPAIILSYGIVGKTGSLGALGKDLGGTDNKGVLEGTLAELPWRYFNILTARMAAPAHTG